MTIRWHYHHTVLGLCMVAFFVTMFARLVISPVVPLITDDFGISNTLIGLALSGIWLAYGLSQFPSGVLADRFGEKAIILLAIGGTGLMSALLALSPIFAVFVVCAMLLGAVAGLHYVVATTLFSRMFNDLGRAVGVHQVGSPIAGLTAPAVGAWVGVRYGWRAAILLSAAVAVPVFVLFFWRVQPTEPRRPKLPMAEQFEVERFRTIITQPKIAFTLFIATFSVYVIQGVFSFLPTFFVEHHGYSPTLAGIIFSVYFLLSSAVRVIVGVVSDKYGRDQAIAGCTTIASAGFVLLVYGSGRLVLSVALVLVALGTGMFAAIDPRFLDNFTEQDRNAGFGVVRTVYSVIGSTGSFGVGLSADLFGWGTAFVILGLVCLFVFLALVINSVLGLGY